MNFYQLMIKANLILLLLIGSTSLFGQYYNRYGNTDTTKIFAIDKYTCDVNAITKRNNLLKLILDSIEVNVEHYDNKIETTSYLGSSKSILKISFYLKDCNLVMVFVREQSPKFSDLSAFSKFYLEKDSIFYSNYYFSIRMCLARPMNMSNFDLYGYNPKLSGDLLKKYVMTLFLRLKTMQTELTGPPPLAQVFPTPLP